MTQKATKTVPKRDRRGGARQGTGVTKENLYLHLGADRIKDLRILARVEGVSLEEMGIRAIKAWLKLDTQKENLDTYRNIIPPKPRKTKPKVNKYARPVR